MKNRKKPERTCIVCRNKFDKRDLTRIVKNKDGEIFLDPTGKANGRGAYICSNPECINKFLKKNFLERTFKQKIEPDSVNTVREELKKIANSEGKMN